jgi:hypothetical protein
MLIVLLIFIFVPTFFSVLHEEGAVTVRKQLCEARTAGETKVRMR